MESEFYNLYNTLRTYKTSIVQNLDKVDKNILESIQEFEATAGPAAPTKKYNISREMVQILQNYVQILYFTENLVNKIPSTTSDNNTTILNVSTNPFKSLQTESFSVLPLIKPELNETCENVSLDNDVVTNTEPPPNIADTLIENQNENVSKEEEKNEEVKSVEKKDIVKKSPPPVQSFPSTSSNKAEDEKSLNKKEVISEVEVSPRKKSVKKPKLNVSPELEYFPSDELAKLEIPPPTATKVKNLTTEDGPSKPTIIRPPKNLNNSVNNASTPEEEVPPPPEPLKTEEPKYSAVTKLLNMTLFDRKKEAEMRYEGQRKLEDFKWKVTTKSPIIEKRNKEKSAIFEISEDDLRVNELCSFSCVVNPNEFYVRINQDLFESLEKSLNEDLNNLYQYVVANHESKNDARKILGDFCFVFLSDCRKWFRVQVVDWMKEDRELVLVQLIDYGDLYHCRYKNLKAMIALYAEFPKMAIRCHLAGILSSSSDKSQWSLDSIKALMELSEMEMKTKFLVIYAQKEGDSYAVDLTKEGSEMSLAQILVGRGLIVEEKILRVIPEEDEEEEVEEYDGLNEAITGYDAKDEQRICRFTDSSGRCFKGPKCKLEHVKLSEDGITTDKVLTAAQALETLQLPEAGEKITILITGYINTCHFYAQIIRNRSKSDLFNDEFQLLKDNMNANNFVQTYEPFKVSPGVGELLLVKFFDEWHRAMCVDLESNRLTVFLVDLGEKFATKMSQVRQIKDEFLHVPFQAVECMLHSCCERSNANPESSKGFFQNSMQLQNFTAEVVVGGEPLQLKLWDANNMEMDYVLKQYGLGQDVNPNLRPKDNIVTIG